MNALRSALGADLRRIRHEQGRPLRDVAAAAYISFTYLAQIERGEKEPSWTTLAAICEALGVSLRVSLHQNPHRREEAA